MKTTAAVRGLEVERRPDQKTAHRAHQQHSTKTHTPQPKNLPHAAAEVTAPPYHVCETGWGGFDISIDVQMRDPALPVLRLTHYLKLYNDGAGPSASASAAAADKPVVSEQFDELVLNALPSDPALRAALLRGPTLDPPPYPYAEHMGVVSSEADLISIAAARKWVADRVEELEERLLKAKASAAALRQVHLGV